MLRVENKSNVFIFSFLFTGENGKKKLWNMFSHYAGKKKLENQKFNIDFQFLLLNWKLNGRMTHGPMTSRYSSFSVSWAIVPLGQSNIKTSFVIVMSFTLFVGKLQVTITKDSIHPCHFLHVVQLIKTKKRLRRLTAVARGYKRVRISNVIQGHPTRIKFKTI